MPDGQFWLIGGPNGAGKTTLTSQFCELMPELPVALNPDAVSLEFLKARGLNFQTASDAVLRECFLTGARQVVHEMNEKIARGEDTGVETVLSTEKYLPLFRQMAQHGGANLIYVGNQSPEISLQRVALRFTKGGHDVPEDKVRARWQRSLELLPTFLEVATRAWVFDHTHSPARLVAKKANGCVTVLLSPLDLEHDVLAEALAHFN